MLETFFAAQRLWNLVSHLHNVAHHNVAHLTTDDALSDFTCWAGSWDGVHITLQDVCSFLIACIIMPRSYSRNLAWLSNWFTRHLVLLSANTSGRGLYHIPISVYIELVITSLNVKEEPSVPGGYILANTEVKERIAKECLAGFRSRVECEHRLNYVR